MSINSWSTRSEAGIAEIDIQYMRLFQIMNEFIKSFRHGRSHSQSSKVLGFLLTHCQEHLQTGEAWMESQGYPRLEEHKAEHRAIMDNVFGIKRGFDSRHLLTMQVTVLLADWLEHHVEGSDIAFVEQARHMNPLNTVA